ncbi:hypothetical protein GQ457_07G039730 [Hibiscus cannabinus]
MVQVRLTGSKLDTPITAPIMATSTTPPAVMLSKKFLREGVTPSAACATSGMTMDVVIAAAVNPLTAFSLSEAAVFTLSLPSDDFAILAAAPDGLTGNALEKASEPNPLFWVARANGRAIETADVEAIGFFLQCSRFVWDGLAIPCQHYLYPTWRFLKLELMDKVIFYWSNGSPTLEFGDRMLSLCLATQLLAPAPTPRVAYRSTVGLFNMCA